MVLGLVGAGAEDPVLVEEGLHKRIATVAADAPDLESDLLVPVPIWVHSDFATGRF